MNRLPALLALLILPSLACNLSATPASPAEVPPTPPVAANTVPASVASPASTAVIPIEAATSTSTAAPTPIPPTAVPPTSTPCPFGQPSIGYFNAIPDSISSGVVSELQWGEIKNAESVTLDHGVGSVGAQGSLKVKPDKTTTYKLTASSCGGQASASVTVNVFAGLPVPEPVSPAGGATIDCTFLRVQWQAVAVQNVVYNVEVDIQQNGSWQFFGGAQNVSGTYYDFPQSLPAQTNARWRVWVTDTINGTEGDKSGWAKFTCQ